MKRPSFQFYPADWQGNSNLRRCTHEEKGIWMDVLCLLHDQEEYGVARWPLKELAQAVGSPVQKLQSLVSKKVLKGADDGQECAPLIYIPRSGRKTGPAVTLIEQQPGPVWYSSRMVEDEYKRVLRGESGSAPKATPDTSPKGGLGEYIGAAPKATPNHSPDLHLTIHPSRARPSSSSTSTSKTLKPDDQAAAVHLPQNAAASPPADPITARAIELASMLIHRGAALQASDPRVRRWAEIGVSDAQALTALDTAQQRREEQANPQPVNAGLIDAILGDLTAPNSRASPRIVASSREGRISNYAAEAAAARGEHGAEHSIGRVERDITGEAERVA